MHLPHIQHFEKHVEVMGLVIKIDPNEWNLYNPKRKLTNKKLRARTNTRLVPLHIVLYAHSYKKLRYFRIKNNDIWGWIDSYNKVFKQKCMQINVNRTTGVNHGGNKDVTRPESA